MMKIKAFFLFPDTDDDFLRIGDDPQTYENLIKEVGVIKVKLKNHKNFELCYDSTNINAFLQFVEIWVDEHYLASIRTQIQTLFGSYSRNISTHSLKKTDCMYVHWNISTIAYENAREIIAEATESKLNEDSNKTVIINIAETYKTERDDIHVIKDALHHNDLPVLVSIPTVDNDIAFLEWVSTLITYSFSLKNKVRFQPTNYKWVKQKIYCETQTNRYWYYDYYHKDNKQHYEVFDAQGKHLGEADMNGTLDTTKANTEKRIDEIIK